MPLTRYIDEFLKIIAWLGHAICDTPPSDAGVMDRNSLGAQRSMQSRASPSAFEVRRADEPLPANLYAAILAPGTS